MVQVGCNCASLFTQTAPAGILVPNQSVPSASGPWFQAFSGSCLLALGHIWF